MSKIHFCKFLTAVIMVMCLSYPSYGGPLYQWPLGDTSMLSDVIRGNDLAAAGNDQCFLLGEQYKDLTGGSISLSKDATEYVEVNLSSNEPFKDLTISILVHQEGAMGGTLFHYAKDDIERFRMRFISSTAVVSFRDEFDNTAGLIPIEELLVNGWNHIVVQRSFYTGEIRVYHNGIQKIKMDEGFPDNLTIPQGGIFMVGSFPNKPDQQFTGSIACLQIFTEVLTEENVTNCWRMCQPNHWIIKPNIALAPDINNPNKHCLIDPPPSPEDNDDIVSLTTLTNEAMWIKTKQRYKWKDSRRTSGYFAVVAKGNKPTSVIAPMAFVNASNVHVCSRLCMRIEGCESFVVDKVMKNSRPCLLYNSVSKKLVDGEGSKYYAIRG